MEPPADSPTELLEDPLEPPLPTAPPVPVPLLDGARALSPQPAKPIVTASVHACAQRAAPRRGRASIAFRDRQTTRIVPEWAERAPEIRFSFEAESRPDLCLASQAPPHVAR